MTSLTYRDIPAFFLSIFFVKFLRYQRGGPGKRVTYSILVCKHYVLQEKQDLTVKAKIPQVQFKKNTTICLVESNMSKSVTTYGVLSLSSGPLLPGEGKDLVCACSINNPSKQWEYGFHHKILALLLLRVKIVNYAFHTSSLCLCENLLCLQTSVFTKSDCAPNFVGK